MEVNSYLNSLHGFVTNADKTATARFTIPFTVRFFDP